MSYMLPSPLITQLLTKYISVINPYMPPISSLNQTIAAYIYFNGWKKEEGNLLRFWEKHSKSISVINPYMSPTSSSNKTSTTYIYFNSQKKEEYNLSGFGEEHSKYIGVINSYMLLTLLLNETIAAYIYFDSWKKEERVVSLQRGSFSLEKSAWRDGLMDWILMARTQQPSLRDGDSGWRRSIGSIETVLPVTLIQQKCRLIKMNKGADTKSVLRYASCDQSPVKSDDNIVLDLNSEAPQLEVTGQIKIALFCMLASREVKRGEYWPQFDAHDDDESEDGQQGCANGDAPMGEEPDIDHTTSFVEPKMLDPKSISIQTATAIDGPEKPYAVFTFFYRGKLKIEDTGDDEDEDKSKVLLSIGDARKQGGHAEGIRKIKSLLVLLPLKLLTLLQSHLQLQYWLVRGAVAVASWDGESTYAELKPGAFFGEIGILMDIPRMATIISRSRCLLVVLSKEDLTKELPKFPEVEQVIRDEAQERVTILYKKNQEAGDVSRLQARGKRAREGMAGEINMGDEGKIGSNGVSKKRKSPSPGVADSLLEASALGGELKQGNGMTGREIYFIVQGDVEVVDEQSTVPNGGLFMHDYGPQKGNNGGTARIKARLKQGQYLGEVVSLSLSPRKTVTIRSVTKVECLMITEQVLAELWRKCPVEIPQVEVMARNSLDSSPLDNNVEMADASATPTPSFDDLEIGDCSLMSSKRQAYSAGAVNVIKPESPHKPSLKERFTSAPPDPPQNGGRNEAQNNQNPSVPRPAPPPTAKAKHATTPPEQHISTKRATTLLRTVPEQPNQFNKGALPDSIPTRIFDYLNIWELMHLKRVSSHWSKLLTSSPDLLHVLDLREFNHKIADEVLIKSICPFADSRPIVVDISNCFHITDEGFTVLAAMCGMNVKARRMKSVWDITGQAVLEMANKARSLEAIDLSNYRKVSDNLLARVVGWAAQDMPPLAQQQQGRQQNSDSEPRNRVLVRAPPGTIIGCPTLKRLTLSYCKHVTDRSMAHLAMHAASLSTQRSYPPPTHLRLEQNDLTQCTIITDQGFLHWSIYQFWRLRKLCLEDCTYLTDNAIVYLTDAVKGLRELDLSSVCALSDTATEVLALGSPHLTILNPSLCGPAVSDSSLRSIGLHLLELRELSMRGCVRITGIGVESVVEGYHNLETFNVSQCKNSTRWLEQGSVEQCAIAFIEELALCENLPAIDVGAAILARLNQLSTSFAGLGNEIRDEVADVRNEVAALRLEASIRDSNYYTRLQNSHVTGLDQALTPLVNQTTGAAIPNFPATSTALGGVSADDLVPILQALGRPTNGRVEVKRKRLRLFIGLVDIS
ncbi:MAG: hypothetical protein M1839_005940 [Geoglossum umbratile]|nr:MAG: hypothetical protein M1839_005940 [Geoglossum umbratile]